MTYGWFLIVFLVVPIFLLGWVMRHDLTRRQAAWICGLMAVALVYTTPWDNYLVATHVWWYDPQRVLGVRFGWVPLEEYLFFLLQPILISLWVLALNRRRNFPSASLHSRLPIRWFCVAVGLIVWVTAVSVLISRWKPGTYLGLELAWALPPILLQLAVGAHILWARRHSVLLTLATATLYLAVADGLAISSGVWMISPEQSLGIQLAGVLPLEEMIFFILTNTLLTFAIHLLLAWEQSPSQFSDMIASRLPRMSALSASGERERING